MARSSTIHPRHVTVPLHSEHNRPLVDCELVAANGRIHTARFLIDTGGGGFIITQTLARSLGIQEQPAIEGLKGNFAAFTPPVVTLAGMPIDLTQAEALIAMGPSPYLLPGVLADGIIGGPVLARYHVIFNYRQGQLTLARPGSLLPRGAAVPTPIHPQSGFPSVELSSEGHSYGLLLDTGASHTMISRSLLDELARRHPRWPHACGAFGSANMGGSLDKEAHMLRLSDCDWGPYRLAGISVVSRPIGVFEERLTRVMARPIIGALGGNVLQCFRTEIDYANQTTYLEQLNVPDAHDMDLAGLMLEPQMNGTYRIQGIASASNDPVVSQLVHVGDTLLRVNGQEMTGRPLTHVVEALRGSPGQQHFLRLERAGQIIETRVPVTRIV